jgi:hypothetical protein
MLGYSRLEPCERIERTKNDDPASRIWNLNVPYAVVEGVEIATVITWESKTRRNVCMKIRFVVPVGALELIDRVTLASKSGQILVEKRRAKIKSDGAVLEEA